MPIKPENRGLYPPRREWLAIRAEVLARAGNRCEFDGCRVEHGEVGYRNKVTGAFISMGEAAAYDADFFDDCRAIKVILTLAHLDHDPRNNGEPGNRPNLRAYCQLHHLRHDAAHHARNARSTRNKKRGQIELSFGEEE